MSTVIVLAPVIIASWPAVSAAVVGAAAAMGLALKISEPVHVAGENSQDIRERQVEIELEDSKVSTANLATDQEIVVTRGAVELRVRRDARGRCCVCARGRGVSDAELRKLAEEFTQRMVQCFTYNQVMTQLKAKGFQVVNEEVGQDESVRIHVRRWEN